MRSLRNHTKYLLALSLVGLISGTALLGVFSHRPAALTSPQLHDAAAKARLSAAYHQLPMHFEINRGQTAAPVEFLAQGPGAQVFLTPTGAQFVWRRNDRSSVAVLRLGLAGPKAQPRLVGLEELPGKVNYFRGSDPRQWHVNVPTFKKVKYEAVYPGVDLIFYGNQQQLEYDFVVAPGADPQAIALSFEGADKLEVDAQGDLFLYVGGEVIRQRRPLVYQEVDGTKREISVGYVYTGEHRIGLQVGDYDATMPLVIDPVLVYSTYLSGGKDDKGYGIAVDAAGNAYVAGATNSPDFVPAATSGAFDTSCGTASVPCNGTKHDGFVMKLDPDGALVYLTYLGGGDEDSADNIAIDTVGNAYVTGGTASSDFPTTANAYQRTQGSAGGFVAKLSADGSVLLHSTFFGDGNGLDSIQGITLDGSASAYVVGTTSSTDLRTKNALYPTFRGGTFDGFVAKFDLSLSGDDSLVYYTYLGGTSNDHAEGIYVDAAGNTYLTGRTESPNFPTTVGAYDTTCGTDGQCNGSNGDKRDVFITRLSSTGSMLLYSTYLGGSGDDAGFGIAADAAGNIYVSGFTRSTNFPITAGAYDTSCGTDGTCNGGFKDDVFVAKLNSTGTALVYSTYLGGRDSDFAFCNLGVDVDGNAIVTGRTTSPDFPTTPGAFDRSCGTDGNCGGGSDAFVTKLNASGTALLYSTYLGGNGDDSGEDIAVDASCFAYVTGLTRSSDDPGTPANEGFPTMNPLRSSFGGETDAFIVKLNIDTRPPVINCPTTPICVTATPGQTSKMVTYPTPTATDNCPGQPTITCSPASGSNFPLGITTITCTATDAANNSASCQFTVAVNGVLFATGDSYLRGNSANANEGANERLRIQRPGPYRPVVRFNLSGISLAGLKSASLALNIASNDNNWGAGRPVDVHRLLVDWTEGNGRNEINVGGGQPNPGTGEGVTWNCAKDGNISNNRADCPTLWNGASNSIALATAPGVLHTNNLLGDVTWTVTADVLAGTNFGWLIKKRQETQNGQVQYYSREGAAGNPNTVPRLVLVYCP